MNTIIRALPLLILCTVLLSACGREKFLGSKPDTANAITVSQALDPRSFGRTVTIKGTVGKVCQEEGCWMVITDGSKSLRMNFKNESFTVPLTLHGEVFVEGVVLDELVDEETAQSIGQSIGMSERSTSAMHGDQRIPMMVTSGIEYSE